MDIADKENKATFNCPVKGSEESVAICVYKRNRAYRGRGSGDDTCTCAIESGKCLIARLMQRRSAVEEDRFKSREPRKVTIPQWLSEAISRIVVLETTISKYPMLEEADKERLREFHSESKVKKK